MSSPTRGTFLYARGFTLIELVVVIGIVGLMLGAAIPLFSSTLAKQRAESVAEEVAISMRLAAQKSVFQQKQHDFVVDFEDHRYWFEYLQAGKFSKKQKMRPAEVKTLAGEFIFVLLYYPEKNESEYRRKSRITFYPDGTATDAILFLGRVSPEDRTSYDSLYGIEIRGSDSRVRVLTKEERQEYDFLL